MGEVCELAHACPYREGKEVQAGAQTNKDKLASAIEDHAAGAGQVMLVQALLVDGLLGDDVAGAEEDGRGDDLGQQGPLDQLGLVPGGFKGLAFESALRQGGQGEVRFSPSEHLD